MISYENRCQAHQKATHGACQGYPVGYLHGSILHTGRNCRSCGISLADSPVAVAHQMAVTARHPTNVPSGFMIWSRTSGTTADQIP